MLGGDAPAGNPISWPGLRVASQTSTMAGEGGIVAAGNLIVANVFVVISAVGQDGFATASLNGNGFASCAWLVERHAGQHRERGALAKMRLTITVDLLVWRVLRGRHRPRWEHNV